MEPLSPSVNMIYFRHTPSFQEVDQLTQQYFIVRTWNKSELAYAIVLELSANGKVNHKFK